MKKRLLFLLMTCIFILLSACSAMRHLSPMEVLKNSIEQPNHIEFYGESVMEFTFDDTEEIDQIKMKEWRNNEMQRVEVDDGIEESVSITNGEQSLVYGKNDTIAYQFQDETNAYGLLEPKEEMDTLLGNLYETHQIELIGDETIAKRKTFHLQASPLEETEDESTYELWIDKQYWVILKMETSNEFSHWKTSYTHIEFNPKFPDNIFDLEPPSGYTLQHADDDNGEVLDLDEVAEVYDGDFLYFPENTELDLDKINYNVFEGGEDEEPFVELTFQYVKNGMPLFSLMVFEAVEEPEELPFEDDEVIEIRGQSVAYLEDANFISWREDGYMYMIDFFDSTVTEDDIQKWTDEMEYVSEQREK